MKRKSQAQHVRDWVARHGYDSHPLRPLFEAQAARAGHYDWRRCAEEMERRYLSPLNIPPTG